MLKVTIHTIPIYLLQVIILNNVFHLLHQKHNSRYYYCEEIYHNMCILNKATLFLPLYLSILYTRAQFPPLSGNRNFISAFTSKGGMTYSQSYEKARVEYFNEAWFGQSTISTDGSCAILCLKDGYCDSFRITNETGVLECSLGHSSTTPGDIEVYRIQIAISATSSTTNPSMVSG